MNGLAPRERLLVLPPADATGLRWAARLATDLPAWDVVVAGDHETAAGVLEDGCRAAYGTLTPALLAHAKNLRWLQAPAAAPAEGYFFPALANHPVTVTNLRGTYTEHVATHATALVLALARNLHGYFRAQSESRWIMERDPSSVIHLSHATAVIVGVGEVGAAIAHQLSGFGMRIVGVDARRVVPPPGVTELVGPDRLDEAMKGADIVVITVPHTPETHRLVDGHRLTLLTPEAVLVNVGRGEVADVDALAQALAAGRLRGAALDVFPQEPLPPGHPLWSEPRAIITPHVASVGPHNDDRRYAVLLENARRFGVGAELLNVVDKASGY